MKKLNPFPVLGYKGPEYFCDRQNETDQLQEALLNGRNITLFSPRRLGKTGLIFHFFHAMQKEKINTFYLDILGTENLNDFISHFANSVLHQLTTPKTFMEKALKIFGSVRPVFSFNEYSGIPKLSFNLQTETEKEVTLSEIFAILEAQKNHNFIAIDEFQQINNYPEKNTDALLRSNIQRLENCNFIFSGSLKHILLPIFSDPKKPFYQSTGFLSLEKINPDTYSKFISGHFNKNGQKVPDTVVDYILEWSKCYTFYTQYLCNRIYARHLKQITRKEVNTAIREIFAERETIYYNYRKLLPSQQYQLLKAFALEDKVTEPTGQEFLKKYSLGNASTVRKSLHALLGKELIFETAGPDKPVYEIYDVFLTRWLQWTAS